MAGKLIINLENLKHNINEIKKVITEKDKNTNILVMVKADAYGAGAKQVALSLEEMGVKYFGVAYLKEAQELRSAGIKGNILVFSGILPDEIDKAVETEATYSISNYGIAKMLNDRAILENKRLKIHLALETGMTRLGITHNNLEEYIDKLQKLKGIEIEGTYSHLSSADCDEEYTKKQLDEFNEDIKIIEKRGIRLKYKHVFNSSAILLCDNIIGNMVRVGICAYGYLPFENNKHILNNRVNLKGIFRLEAPVCEIREFEKGVFVSYSKTFVTKRKTKIATLQIGYADGLSRGLSNKYSVDVNGSSCEIIGNICMDMCMIDVTDIDDIKVGDCVTIFDFTDCKVDEIAQKTGTINYEVLTGIGKRVDRFYE